jgi:hypothetical protein
MNPLSLSVWGASVVYVVLPSRVVISDGVEQAASAPQPASQHGNENRFLPEHEQPPGQ